MSTAWETTTDDVSTVLERHGIRKTNEEVEEIYDTLDHDAIVSGLLYYTNMDAQTNSMLQDIEDQLMESGILPKGEKKFPPPDDDFELQFDPEEHED